MLPTEIMEDVNRKIVPVHGCQLKVVVIGKMTEPLLCAKKGGTCNAVRLDATVQDVRQTNLKYSDVTDIKQARKSLSLFSAKVEL